MNKNVIFGLLGVGVFAVLLFVMWGRGKGDGGPAFEPAANPMEASAKGTEEETKKPFVIPPMPQPGERKPPVPVEPGPGETKGPEGEGEKPKEGEGEVKDPTTYDPSGVKVVVPKSEAKTRITAGTDAVDEESREAAAGHLERPMLLKEEEKAEGEGEKKKYPDSYVTEKVMSLYRVAEIVYGDATKWQILFEANKTILEDPEKVDAGTRLTVPDPETPAGEPGKKKKASLSDGLF